MRRLHAVGKQEKFIASGRYEQALEGEPSGVVEEWSIHEVGGQAQFVRVDHDARRRDGYSLLMEALIAPDGEFQRVDRQEFHEANSQPIRSSLVYYDEFVDLTHTAQDTPQRIDLAPDTMLWPGSWLLLGMVALNAQRLLMWDTEESVWATLGLQAMGFQDTIINGQEHRVQKIGLDSQVIWLDDYGVLFHLESDMETVTLTQYSRQAGGRLQ